MALLAVVVPKQVMVGWEEGGHSLSFQRKNDSFFFFKGLTDGGVSFIKTLRPWVGSRQS